MIPKRRLTSFMAVVALVLTGLFLALPGHGAEPVVVASSTFEDGTAQGWRARGGETVAASTLVARTGSHSLAVTGRTANWEGPTFDILDKVARGTRYTLSAWVRLAPGEAATTARMSVERRTGGTPSYEGLVGDTAVTADGWVNLSGQYTLARDAEYLTVYVETASATASLHIDDFTLSHVPMPPVQTDIPPVKDVWAGHFSVGAAVGLEQIVGDQARLVERHFNSVTPGNSLKWDATEPAEGDFRFDEPDEIVAWAKARGTAVRGHTLVWHNQTPAWVFKDAAGNDMTATPENKQLLLARVEAHIRAVVGRYGADIGVWDVVNEVIDEAQPDGLRRNRWFEITGLDYIRTAFRVAHEVAPGAVLVINDYNTNVPAKRDHLYHLIAQLKAEGVPVHAVGHQMHVNVDWPSVAETDAMITTFAPLGIDQQITEMDISVYTDNSQSYPSPPRELLIKQAYRYRDLFDVFKRHSALISSVTTWGVADDGTWLDKFPVTRKDHPLLFDVQWQAKPAYWGVVDPGRIEPSPPVGCAVTYASTQWPGGFRGEVKITNLGGDAVSGWALRWAFPDGQRVTQLWNGSHTQEGAEVTVTNADWNRVIAPGGSVVIGFLGTWAGNNAGPTAFSFNGATCTS